MVDRIYSDLQIILISNLQKALFVSLSHAQRTLCAILGQHDAGPGTTSLPIHNILLTEWHTESLEKGQQVGEST